VFYEVSLEETKTEFQLQGWECTSIYDLVHEQSIQNFTAAKSCRSNLTGGVVRFLVNVWSNGVYTFQQRNIDQVTAPMVPVEMNHPDVIVAQNILTGALSVRYNTGAGNSDEELQSVYGNPTRTFSIMNTLCQLVESLGVGWETADVPVPAGTYHYIRFRHPTLVEHLYLSEDGSIFTHETTDAMNWDIRMTTVQSPSLAMTMCSLWNAYIRLSGLLDTGFEDMSPVLDEVRTVGDPVWTYQPDAPYTPRRAYPVVTHNTANNGETTVAGVHHTSLRPRWEFPSEEHINEVTPGAYHDYGDDFAQGFQYTVRHLVETLDGTEEVIRHENLGDDYEP
jgi:hypothetical protein